MTHRVLARIVVTAALVAGCAGSRVNVSADVAVTTERAAAPAFTLRNVKGAAVRLADYQGKVLLLDFWATWCTGCKQEIPWYMEFQTKYQRQGLRSLGVAMDEEGWRVVTPYLRQHPINYPIVIVDEAFAKLFPITAMPVTLLIDRDGRVADAHVGVVDKSTWEQEIRVLLEERPKKR